MSDLPILFYTHMETEKKIPITAFWDMHSGGGTKEPPYEYIYIEAPEEEAKLIFQNRFGHNPDRVSCTCCGNDYSISQSDSIELTTAYHRNCRWAYYDKKGKEISEDQQYEAVLINGKALKQRKKGITGGYIEEPDTKYDPNKKLISMKDYLKKKDVLFIRDADIKDDERQGILVEEGYVWR